MNQLEVLRESLGQCDEIVLDALLMRNRIVEDIMAYKEANDIPILQPEQEAKQREWLNRRMEGRRHKDEVTAVFEEITRNSKRIQARKLFDYNIVLIGFMSTNKPVNSFADFKGQKIRTMENSYHLAFWKALGANPTPMSFSEVYIGQIGRAHV